MGKGKHDQASLNELQTFDFEPCVIVHGGAWSLPSVGDMREKSEEGVQFAAKAGYQAILKGGNALDGVEAAVRSLEDNPVFNAGYGSVPTEDGTVEMDAMIMDGSSLDTGAVACVKGIANPVSLARRVMTDTPHCLLVSDGAIKFAEKMNIPILDNPSSLLSEYSLLKSREQKKGQDFRQALAETMNTESTGDVKDMKTINKRLASMENNHDTVGAVVMDCHGNLAAATSTGGLVHKMAGRVGDSPIAGSGGYANREGGASTTGHGESILKVVLAREVICQLENGCSAQEACVKSMKKMFDLTGGQGGVICIDKNGQYGKAFTTQNMCWAAIKGGIMKYGIDPGQEFQADKCVELSQD